MCLIAVDAGLCVGELEEQILPSSRIVGTLPDPHNRGFNWPSQAGELAFLFRVTRLIRQAVKLAGLQKR